MRRIYLLAAILTGIFALTAFLYAGEAAAIPRFMRNHALSRPACKTARFGRVLPAAPRRQGG